MQQAVQDVETQIRTLREKGEAIPSSVRGSIAVDEYCALSNRPDIDDAILEAERNLKAAQEQESIRHAEGFDHFLLPEIRIADIERILAEGLADLDATAAAQVQAHLSRIGEGAEAWVASGMERLGGLSLTSCPFCAQDLDGARIIQHYRVYFSEAYTDLKERIASVIQDFAHFHGTGATGDFA